MIVANFENVKYVYVSENNDPPGVTVHFIDGTEMPLSGMDADKVKAVLRTLLNATKGWYKIAYGGEE